MKGKQQCKGAVEGDRGELVFAKSVLGQSLPYLIFNSQVIVNVDIAGHVKISGSCVQEAVSCTVICAQCYS